MTVCTYGFEHKIEAIIFAKKEIKIVIDKLLAVVASHGLLKKAHDCELKRWLELDAFGALPFAGWLYVSTIMQPAKCFVDYYCSEPQSIMSRWRSHWLTSSPSNHFDHHQDHETGVGGGATATNGATATKATTIPLLCFRLQYRVNSLSRFRKSNNTQLGGIVVRGGEEYILIFLTKCRLQCNERNYTKSCIRWFLACNIVGSILW